MNYGTMDRARRPRIRALSLVQGECTMPVQARTKKVAKEELEERQEEAEEKEETGVSSIKKTEPHTRGEEKRIKINMKK